MESGKLIINHPGMAFKAASKNHKRYYAIPDILMRLHPPGSDTPYNGVRLSRFLAVDKDVYNNKNQI